jgi:hypothetical protein
MKESPERTVTDVIGEHTFADEENFWAFNVRTVAQKRANRSLFFTINREVSQLDKPHREGCRSVMAHVGKNVWANDLFVIFGENPSAKLTLEVLQSKIPDYSKQPVPTFLRTGLRALVDARLVVKYQGSPCQWMWNDVDGRDDDDDETVLSDVASASFAGMDVDQGAAAGESLVLLSPPTSSLALPFLVLANRSG